MLPQANRIKKKKDFETIFKNAKSFRNNLFIFKIVRNSLDFSRFGFVVSQKVSKNATTRNKVRRRLAESIKAEMDKIEKGLDFIIIALPGIEKKDFCEIKENVKKILISSGTMLK